MKYIDGNAAGFLRKVLSPRYLESFMSSYVDRIKPDSFGITTYLDNLKRGQYQIPTFQRDVVWERDQVKRLWDSIYKFYPLGSILVWRTDTKLQRHRQIGGHLLLDDTNNKEFQYLLDGQQRTTALLTSMYGGSIKGRSQNSQLFVNLTVKDSEEIEDESWRERFLFWDEIDDRGGELLRNKGRKQRYDSGLIVKLEDIAQQYSEVEERLEEGEYRYGSPERTQLRKFRQVLDNYKLSFIELRGIEVSEVCQIFERINQAGQPLSMFDIVVAKTFRPIDEKKGGFYLRGLFEQFRKDLEDSNSQFSKVDDMTLLQILAVLVRDTISDSGVLNITDRYLNALRTEHIEEVWQDGTKAIRKVFDFFDNHLRLSGPTLVPYRYFYMTLASYFFRNPEPVYSFLKSYFWYYSCHNYDLLSNTTHLYEHVRKLKQFRDVGEFGFDKFQIDRNRLRDASYSNRGRLSRAILALYASQDPRDWAVPDRSVLSQVYYALTDKPNLHHIFPRDYCEKHLGKYGTYADSLMNIAYLTQITNLKISNKNPLEYIRDYLGENFSKIEQTHLLPGELAEWVKVEQMPQDALNCFIENRIDLVLNKLREYLKDVPFEVNDSRLTEASE
ncbi:MAG: DUF262 domain-containing protein [Leptolyngbya sp. BL-A-14]